MPKTVFGDTDYESDIIFLKFQIVDPSSQTNRNIKIKKNVKIPE